MLHNELEPLQSDCTFKLLSKNCYILCEHFPGYASYNDSEFVWKLHRHRNWPISSCKFPINTQYNSSKLVIPRHFVLNFIQMMLLKWPTVHQPTTAFPKSYCWIINQSHLGLRAGDKCQFTENLHFEGYSPAWCTFISRSNKFNF